MNKGLSGFNLRFLYRSASGGQDKGRFGAQTLSSAKLLRSLSMVTMPRKSPSRHWLAGALCLAGLVGAALPGQAQGAQGQEPVEETQIQVLLDKAQADVAQPHLLALPLSLLGTAQTEPVYNNQMPLAQATEADDAQQSSDAQSSDAPVALPEAPSVPTPDLQEALDAQAPDVQGQDALPVLPPVDQAMPSDGVPADSVMPALPAVTPPVESVVENDNDVEAEVTLDVQNQVPSLPTPYDPRYQRPLLLPDTVITPSELSPAFDDYHLGPGDTFFVSVQRYPDLSFEATLDLQGNVVVPIQGAVPFEGLTLAEAEDRLRLIYNQYVVIREVRDVTITLTRLRPVEVTILGSVQRPGFYPLADPSVATALLTAGGATRTSDLRAIQVQRRLQRNGGIVEETVNVDLFTPLKEGSPLPDVRLADGDVVIIPELDLSQIDEYDRNLVANSTLAQPIINVRFLNYASGRGGIGTLNLNNGSTFLDAISQLGVNDDDANLGEVALIRYDPETGRAVTLTVDAKAGILGDITQNPPLEDSDVIVVGRNFLGRLSFALRTITQPFSDVFGFTRFFDNFFDDNLF